MKKIALLGLAFAAFTTAFAQVGFKRKKEDIEKFKDTRLVVVLSPDSAYNASIIEAVEKYWTFNGGFLFEYDSAMKPYNKPEYSYLYFSKSKGTKIKAKLGTCEDDFNGLLITTGGKFKKKALKLDLVAGAFCSNFIDTADWRPELTRAVQMLNNYLNTAIEADGDKGITTNYIADNAPTNSSLLDQTLLLPLRSLDLKGKEDAATLWGGEVEDVEVDETYKAIMSRSDKIIFYYSKDEKRCNKIVTSTSGELVYFAEDAVDKCKLTAKDLKAMNAKRTRATK
jgi:hypothetical protein